MAGMPSLGGPPEMISESETLSLLKLVFCQSRLMMGWSGESMVGSPKSCAFAVVADAATAMASAAAAARLAWRATLTAPRFLVERVVGAAGFEPADAGAKNRCLTAWLRPSSGDAGFEEF